MTRKKKTNPRRREATGIVSCGKNGNGDDAIALALAAQKSDEQVMAVDLVTGKVKVEYFFDPSLLVKDDSKSFETPVKSKPSTPFRKDVSSSSGAEANTLFSKYLFMPCTIIKPLDDESSKGDGTAVPVPRPTLVKTSDGALHKISDSTKLIPLTSPDDYLGVDDVLHLPDVSEASLLHTLRLRYNRNDIYTNAGPILISVNPYKTVASLQGDTLYSENRMIMYRNKPLASPAHLFQVADRAYTAMMRSANSDDNNNDSNPVAAIDLTPMSFRNQSIIISGESGAGKTEATKIIMQFLARITKNQTERPTKEALLSPDGKMVAALEDRVLSSNPLLETFGNARTLRNDNSSRFGKFIHIYFSTDRGTIVGATISNYLLEKTRITHQIEGERNYHIFYQLLAKANQPMLTDLGLEAGPIAFAYLCRRDERKQKQDDASFLETKECLSRIGLTFDDQAVVFGIVAAVLHLGNIEFEQKGNDHDDHDGHSDTAKIKESTRPSLKRACHLLGLDESNVEEAILTKLLNIGGKIIHKHQSIAQAQDKRDAFAKLVYSCLFLWLVQRVNETLTQTSESHWDESKPDHSTPPNDDNIAFIGVLDIYGFEVFETNGFEQFLINYCNEKLQRHFNKHLFEVEQDLYASEGVDWTYITFNDNRPCLELIEGSPGYPGILNTLDDSWGGMGTASEKEVKFVGHLHKKFGGLAGSTAQKGKQESGHQYFVTPKFGSDRQFIICHYAGIVRYTATGFVEKNMETLSNELKDLGETSTIDLAKKCFKSMTGEDTASSPTGRRSTIRGVSVGTQFRTSLQSLVSDLETTQPHYIRCIKPNGKKAPNALDSGEVLRQLRYSGMMETIRIRREGYALREDHQSFYNRFAVLLNPEDVADNGTGIEHMVKVLSKRLSITEVDWQIGHSKIFLRKELADKLERLARLRVRAAAATLTKFGRCIAHKRAAKLLVAFVRFRLHMLEKYRRDRAATKIMATFKGSKQRKSFSIMVSAATMIQAFQRRRTATLIVRKMRDPYADKTFAELNALLSDEAKKLEKSVQLKDFRLAARLEETLESLKVAVEAKRPLTRTLLEEQISGIQHELDQALGHKNYMKCNELQAKLEVLTGKRAELPTIEELTEAVTKVQLEIASAVERKDYAMAAEAQQRIEAAQKRLDDALEVEREVPVENSHAPVEGEGIGFITRGEVSSEIHSLNTQIEEALARKDFTLANDLQPKLDSKKTLLEQLPSLSDLRSQLDKANKRMDRAQKQKDWKSAEHVQQEISLLEEKIAREESASISSEGEPARTATTLSDGKTKIFETRGELENEIRNLSVSVSDAVAKKSFKEAEKLQADVDALEKLREQLPSVSELQSGLADLERQFDAAVSSKQFSHADDLNKGIEEMKSKLIKEKELSNAMGDVATEPVAKRSEPKPTIGQLQSQKPTSVPQKSVSKLRPIKPVLALGSDSIVMVSKLMSSKRARAAMVAGGFSGVAGIITDSDIVRRVVAKQLNPTLTSVSHVMTSKPKTVSLGDSAMDAMMMMIEKRFRHLPVVDNGGQVCGLLDIGKCLHDAISKLEHKEEKSANATQGALLQVANLQHATSEGSNVAALQALLGPLMATIIGGDKGIPTLRSILEGKPSTVVPPHASVRDAAIKMSETRKAALVVDSRNKLVGLLSFKDVVVRVVAKELSLDETRVCTVMTPGPECLLPDASVLEALQTMYDHGFLTLPVCEVSGKIVGIVDVMEVIYACGGVDSWRSIFVDALSVATEPDGDNSVGGTVHSLSTGGNVASRRSRLVGKLRPKKPLVSKETDSILSVAQMLANKRGDASLVVKADGSLAGIITDTDFARKVVSKNLPTSSTYALAVMTPNPTCVRLQDPAMDALSTMMEHRFRHLPVVDDKGSVVGLLDIAKCLNDAIAKLEKKQERGRDEASQALTSALLSQGRDDKYSDASRALLAQLMSQAFGQQTSPKLRSVLAGKPATVVAPDTSIRDVGLLMAKSRKAALVVDSSGILVGLFSFKDLMSRAVAKELPLEHTHVSSVMTTNPESVEPDTGVVEALQMMHDNRFLTLPVCESDGRVVGLVDVMDLMYACGGAEGWRSLFSGALEHDDFSETGSVISRGSASLRGSRSFRSGSMGASRSLKKTPERTVAKLRPKKPVLASGEDSVLSLSQTLSRRRADASLIVSDAGRLSGILTDKDVCRRVVARRMMPSSTSVREVMTPDPMCVRLQDPAMDALIIMVEKRFRHLPVVDENGSVVGLLDITRCLRQTIEKLERSQKKQNSDTEEAFTKIIEAQGGENAKAALKSLLGPLIASAFGGGGTVPTLRSLLESSPATSVPPELSVLETAVMMSQRQKAALVVDNNKRILGIFGFKDLMTRAVAKELSLESTPVAVVMTPNPDTVPPDITVLEALQTMHDNRFLTLPVCESDGRVLGIFDVMDLISACGGADGWRSIFNSAMELDDGSESLSLPSKGGGLSHGEEGSRIKTEVRPVSKLRPMKPTIVNLSDSVISVSKLLASRRARAAVVPGDYSGVKGLISDSDIVLRVVEGSLDPTSATVSEVFSQNSTSVAMSDAATEALSTMIENRHRHLPVLNETGEVCGLLDIGKCLNDAISKLEHREEKTVGAAKDALMQVADLQASTNGSNAAALQALLGPLMSAAIGNGKTTPTLRSILACRPSAVVKPTETVRVTAEKMAESKRAALIADEGGLVGVLSFKDVMSRVIAKELALNETMVSTVMTPNPESLLPDATVLEALQVMYDNGFFTLPVCESDGRIVGVVDVMDVIHACGGSDGWRSLFDDAMNIDDGASFSASFVAPLQPSAAVKQAPTVQVNVSTPFASTVPQNIEIENTSQMENGSLMDSFFHGASRGYPGLTEASFDTSDATVFKVVEESGNTHRIRCEMKIAQLKRVLIEKVGEQIDPSTLKLKFVDDEGDIIMITSDECLAEAVGLSRSSGSNVVKLSAAFGEPKSTLEEMMQNPVVLAAVGAIGAAFAVVVIVVLRSSKK